MHQVRRNRFASCLTVVRNVVALTIVVTASDFCGLALSAEAKIPLASHAAQIANTEGCPPQYSSIALFTRQAFDPRRGELRPELQEYAHFITELSNAAVSSPIDTEVVRKSIEVSESFVAKMEARGSSFSLGDLIIHLETQLNNLARTDMPIPRARYKLELAVVREMKRVICR
jgi:hypothetical protein